MKDLYTFDYSSSKALKTYDAVRDCYTAFFDELKLPYLVANADSGDMGGDLSHEYHFPSGKGEDTIISCSNCDFVVNEELAGSKVEFDWLEKEYKRTDKNTKGQFSKISKEQLHGEYDGSMVEWIGIDQDRLCLVKAFYPRFFAHRDQSPAAREINLHVLKAAVKSLDLSVEDPRGQWNEALKEAEEDGEVPRERPRIIYIFDCRASEAFRSSVIEKDSDLIYRHRLLFESVIYIPDTKMPLDLMKPRTGDRCPKCSDGTIKTQQAIELGHTFFLGTRYSKPLQASVSVDPSLIIEIEDSSKPNGSKSETVPLQMGCHGIGVSRMISAVADSLADTKGLNWPRVLAPFEAVVIPTKGLESEAVKVYDSLVAGRSGMDPNVPVEEAPVADTIPANGNPPIDVVLDDREKDLAWKLADADLIGYPVIVVIGKSWKKEGKCEVQCRRLEGLRTNVAFDELPSYVNSLLSKL